MSRQTMNFTQKLCLNPDRGEAASQAVASRDAGNRHSWTGWLSRSVAALRAVAPYAAIELLLPGGSLMALGLWLLQRRRPS